MSRVAKKPVILPDGAEVTVNGQEVTFKGKIGSAKLSVNPKIKVIKEENELRFEARDNSPGTNAIAGTARALVNNYVLGVTEGFKTDLKLVGVGYRAQIRGKELNLTLGLSHPVNYPVPEGITIETPSQTEITVKGVDKQLVGQVVANIRKYRPPEPYKGKGIRRANESIKLKETKKK